MEFSDKIYIFHKEWRELIIKKDLKITDEVNRMISNIITDDQKNHDYNKWEDPWKVIHSIKMDDVQKYFIFIGKNLYRRCSTYFVLQLTIKKYSKTFRILVYGSDHINHYGQSFGTSLNCIKETDIIQHIKDHLNKIIPKEISDVSVTKLLETYQKSHDINLFYLFLNHDMGI